MNKLLKAFFIGSLAIVTDQLQSISLTDYIQQYGMPKVEYGKLNLFNKNLTDLTGLQDIPHIDQVRELNLSFNKLQILPNTIFNGLHNLDYLYLNHNQIQTLPSSIFSDLQNLQVLFLENNQIKTLPSNIFNGLHNLRIIILNNNQIQTLPNAIFNGLHNLMTLNFSSNQIQTLPDTIFNDLHNLCYLDLYNNQIQTLPATIFNGLEGLLVLNLEGNHFTLDFIPTLTDLLWNLPKLSYINGMPRSEALRKPPFGTLKKLAATNIVQNLDKYWPSLHTLPEDILDLLPLTELQRQEIKKRQVA